ncbi:alternative ribosome rescue factor ArfA [Vibrio parahaemolyticus]|uniref:Alternative ribosome rescue factor ArfA n=1 Tax=Vibrio parahaemolyticus TaxID=670 RepID=A0AAW8Q4G1_VIBPH|nr:alternative ribosome rescue factor ArfA [Vibrio parahaemolyticus]EGR2227305.1 alternative ribosome-rescue factor A [Vibrio parahaemolyticus]MDS1821353.1 alternative ribosome rescue factor ArfA [Vibrio parahaemolyticus]
MSKNKNKTSNLPHDIGRGEVKDSHLGALVTSKLFRARSEVPAKGKGSYKRKEKHRKGKEPYQSAQNSSFR